MINELPTAFPWQYKDVACTGMTLRDYFAGIAMQSLTGREDYADAPSSAIALDAYDLADEMIKARMMLG